MSDPITPKQFDAELRDLLRVVDETRNIGLRGATRYSLARGAADVRELARTAARDGAEASTTLAKASTVIVGVDNALQLRADLATAGKLGKLDRDAVAVGRVTASRTQVFKGMTVTITTDQGAVAGTDAVDSDGLYSIIVPRAEFDKIIAGSRQLLFTLRDSNKAASREVRLPAQPGVAQILVVNFDIRVASTKPTTPGTGPVRPSDGTDPKPAQPKPVITTKRAARRSAKPK